MKKSSRSKIKSSLHNGSGPIARKVIAKARQSLQEKVTNLSDWKTGKVNAENFQKTVIEQEKLTEYDPAHAIYIYAQNQLSVLIEQIIELPMLDKLADAYDTELEEYAPSSPPMSPVTTSFFTCWSSFDLTTTGSKKETFASIAIDFCKFMNVDPGLVGVYEKMQASRMGIYKHEGSEAGYVFLTELITHKKFKVIVPSGYLGETGELWFVRILPPPFEQRSLDYSVVFTTPYVLGKNGIGGGYITSVEADWLAFFDRNLGETGIEDKVTAYEHLMKSGLNRNYWLEYIFLAYRNYKHDVIFLEGFPDILESLPLSDLSRSV